MDLQQVPQTHGTARRGAIRVDREYGSSGGRRLLRENRLVVVELDLIDAATQCAADRCLLFGLQLDRCRAAVVARANRLQPLPKALLVVVPASPPLRRPKRVTGDLDLIAAQDHVRTVVVTNATSASAGRAFR